MDREAEAALLLQNIEGLAPARQLALLAELGSFSALPDAGTGTLGKILPPPELRAFRAAVESGSNVRDSVERQQETLRRHKAVAVPLTSDDYPALLKEISSPPPVLFVRGDVGALSLPQIAIVGSRRATASGAATARDFAQFLAASGFAITSGMALGIDAQAHSGALEAGITIAVTGAGIDVVYPKQHVVLQQSILDSGGAVVTEFLPGAEPRPQHFPRRNRVISGLSLGVLVVEAAIKSGSLITARAAMNQGREVFAVPGSIHNPMGKGCNHLIREGATLVEAATDIVTELGGMLAYKQQELAVAPMAEATPGEQHVLDALGYDPADVDSLLQRTGLDISSLNQQLVGLELKGLVENRDGRYLRC